jgi:hypothetical protein
VRSGSGNGPIWSAVKKRTDEILIGRYGFDSVAIAESNERDNRDRERREIEHAEREQRERSEAERKRQMMALAEPNRILPSSVSLSGDVVRQGEIQAIIDNINRNDASHTRSTRGFGSCRS